MANLFTFVEHMKQIDNKFGVFLGIANHHIAKGKNGQFDSFFAKGRQKAAEKCYVWYKLFCSKNEKQSPIFSLLYVL